MAVRSAGYHEQTYAPMHEGIGCGLRMERLSDRAIERNRHAPSFQAVEKEMKHMKNSVQSYHWGTAYDPLEMKGHRLDWANQPTVYKHIEGLPSVMLPDVMPSVGANGSTIAGQVPDDRPTAEPSLGDLARMLRFGYGITAKRSYPTGVYEYRSVPSAGALYPCELYAACHGLDGLSDGLYHYEMSSGRLVRLRDGVHTLPPGSPDFWMAIHPVTTFYVTAMFYRSVWKYRDRAYRYHLLDSGHLVESLVLVIRALGFQAEVSYDFDDEQTNALLGVDSSREACLAIVAVKGRSPRVSMDRPAQWDPIPEAVRACRVSAKEDIPETIRFIHAASSQRHRPQNEGRLQPFWDIFDTEERRIPVRALEDPLRLSWEQAVLSRRSSRNFVPKPISEGALSDILRSLASFPEDRCWPHRFVSCGVLSAACESIENGHYGFDPEELSLIPIRKGDMMEPMADIALQQRWLSLAGLEITFVASLQELHAMWGARGYRYAMLSAGRLAHRVYIAATAIGLGCCGIGAFFDGHAASFLQLPPQCALLYFVGVGPTRGRE